MKYQKKRAERFDVESDGSLRRSSRRKKMTTGILGKNQCGLINIVQAGNELLDILGQRAMFHPYCE